MSEKVRIAVVGGGRTGAPLIEDFLKRPFVELVGVADVNPDSPGAALAIKNGVFYTADATEFASADSTVDIIVEVSGDAGVKASLKDAFIASDNRHTLIMHDVIARLIMSMVSDADTLLESVHPEDRGIG